VRYARRVASYLHERGAELIVIACNTATAHALPALQQAGAAAGVPVIGVIEPGVRAALAAHVGGAVAVLATEGTVEGGAYQRALAAARPDLSVFAVPCPLLVPLAEEGWVSGQVPELVVERYVGTLRGRVDTAILGCTHYPLLRLVFERVLPGIALIDSATATAAVVRDLVGVPGPGRGERRYLVTDNVDRFIAVGDRFLGHRPDPVTWVDLPPARGAFADPDDLGA
jgi:glutamate racemase